MRIDGDLIKRDRQKQRLRKWTQKSAEMTADGAIERIGLKSMQETAVNELYIPSK